jgi:hypothetical protein
MLTRRAIVRSRHARAHLVVVIALLCLFAAPTALATPVLTNFSFRLNADRTLNCSLTIGLEGSPNQARCDGYTGNTQGAGALVGGSRGALRVAERKCNQLAERDRVGMAVAGLIVDQRGRGMLSCVGDAEGGGTYLRVGHHIATGPFTCTGLAAGLRCVARSGHGFFFGDTSWAVF